jgi:4-diphosphocytidyl-2-C-methyl-D-erythritol kinase
MPRSVERKCYAKINLALAVGLPIASTASDAGLHPIHSWMCSIGLHDSISIRRLSTNHSTYVRVLENGPPVPWPEDEDLAVRAHQALENHLGQRLPINLHLRKAIPAGGGLGGGSSDAAGVLLGLRDLFELDLSTQTMRTIAASLGSDIPFFIDDSPIPRPAIVSGTGNAIERKPGLDARVLLIIPPFDCHTGQVYRAFDRLGLGGSFDDSRRGIDLAVERTDLSALGNDLYQSACAVRPNLADLRDRIEQACPERVHLSGSGSTLFMLNANTAAEALEQIAPGCRVISTQTL